MGKTIFQKISLYCQRFSSKPVFVPRIISQGPNEDIQFKYELTIWQRVFVLLEDFNSCILAAFISTLIQIAVVIGVTASIVASLPIGTHTPVFCNNPACNDDPLLCPGTMICAPQTKPVFDIIQYVLFFILIVDYGTRLSLVMFVSPRLSGILPKDYDLQQIALFDKGKKTESDPEMSMHYKFYKYCIRVSNIIDMLSCLPTFIQLVSNVGSNSTIVRTLKIARIFRILKLSKSNDTTVTVMFSAVSAASQSLVVLMLCAFIVIILFGSIEYALENGNFVVSSEFPKGAYVVPSFDGSGNVMTPFRTVLDSMYWAAITLTTVGYGDIYPQTAEGRLVASVLALLGNLMLSLPVTVVGHFFQRDFQDFVEARKRSEQANLLKFVEESERREREKLELQKQQKQKKKKRSSLFRLPFDSLGSRSNSDSGSDSDSDSNSDSATEDELVSRASKDSALQEIEEVREKLKTKLRSMDLSALIERGHGNAIIEKAKTSGDPLELRALVDAIDASSVNLGTSSSHRLGLKRSSSSKRNLDASNIRKKSTRVKTSSIADSVDQQYKQLDREDDNKPGDVEMVSMTNPVDDKPRINANYIRDHLQWQSSEERDNDETHLLESYPSLNSIPDHAGLEGTPNHHRHQHMHHHHVHHSKSNYHRDFVPASISKAVSQMDTDVQLFEEGNGNVCELLSSVIAACDTFEKELDIQRKFAHRISSCAKVALAAYRAEKQSEIEKLESDQMAESTSTPVLSSEDEQLFPRIDVSRNSNKSGYHPIAAFSPDAMTSRAASIKQTPVAVHPPLPPTSGKAITPPIMIHSVPSFPLSNSIVPHHRHNTTTQYSQESQSTRSRNDHDFHHQAFGLSPRDIPSQQSYNMNTSLDSRQSSDSAILPDSHSGEGIAFAKPKLVRAKRVVGAPEEEFDYWNSPFVDANGNVATEYHEI